MKSKEEYCEEFIRKSIAKHNGKYDYSKVNYVNKKTKVIITCPIHGDFEQIPSYHVKGGGCPKCGRIIAGAKSSQSNPTKLSKETFIERATKQHGSKYDYSNVVYVNQYKKVSIICPIHGEFTQTPKNHMNGQGCPECGKKYAKEWSKNNPSSFLATAKTRFKDDYEYPKIDSEYENSHSKITIRCKKCGNEFIKIACDHLTSTSGGCGHCYHCRSKAETEIADFIKNLDDKLDVTFNDRTLIKGFEIDIAIHSKRVCIEFNGLYWHKDKDKNYHLMKTEACENIGYRLIQIFEDEYVKNKEIVLSKIRHILNENNDLPKIYARKTHITEINYKEAKEFLEENHIQGGAHSTLYIGAFYDDKLYAVMSFLKIKENEWELNRFASDINYRMPGVGGKLFSFFIKKYKPHSVKSFADRRWTTDKENNLYTNMGFKLVKTLNPDYKYFIVGGGCIRHHKFSFRKRILSKKYGLDLNLTESEMTERINAHKIWDCGLFKYVWMNN